MSENRKIKIVNKELSNHSPAFIVAEAACNHMCDVGLAKKMIDEAKDAGVDAIKFQTYKAERLVCEEAKTYWNYSTQAKSQFEYYKNLDKFDWREYKELFTYARQKELIAFSTPFDVESASMLHEVGAPLFKIASCDLLDIRLLRHVARFGKPMIMSTGGSELSEIQKTVEVVLNEGCSELVLMVCTLSYPALNTDAHLKRIITFKKLFPELIIGYSDHTKPDEYMMIPSMAVALGAKVIEKHFTLDRTLTGSGHAFSVNPQDLRKMVINIRVAEEVLGSSAIEVHESERAARQNARRSLVANRNIKEGEIISSDMVAIKRPGTGLSADKIDDVLGKKVKTELFKDQQILSDHLSDSDKIIL